MYEALAILATFALVYGAVAGGVERTWLSGPIVFTAFGLLIGDLGLGQGVQHISWPILLYSVLSLTVARMLPVFVSVAGLGISTQGKLFLGWFGPRGLASIVFAAIVISAELPHGQTIATVVACTVMLSILVHGATANPWARAYGAQLRRSEREA